MEMTHAFTVHTSPEATWTAFGDFKEIAQCFPGATVTKIDGDDFDGIMTIKMDPSPWSTGETGPSRVATTTRARSA